MHDTDEVIGHPTMSLSPTFPIPVTPAPYAAAPACPTMMPAAGPAAHADSPPRQE